MIRPIVLLTVLAACSAGPEPSDTGTDAGTTSVDAGTTDAGVAPVTVPLPGFGTITGDCGVLDDELTASGNFAFRNHLDFQTDPYDPGDKPKLSDDGRRMADTPNAGGSSLLSEVFSLEVLHRCELASLLKTETEVKYTTTSTKITDVLVEMDGLKIGVSVTRAVTFPRTATYALQAAKDLLKKKLEGINDSTLHVAEADRWKKQALHVLAYSDAHADTFKQAWDEADAALKRDTVLILTVTDGDDEFIYGG